MLQQIKPASTIMIAIEDAKTGRSMKNLTIQTPAGAGTLIGRLGRTLSAADSRTGPGAD
jgi:hypothetical protein